MQKIQGQNEVMIGTEVQNEKQLESAREAIYSHAHSTYFLYLIEAQSGVALPYSAIYISNWLVCG